jgi:hypothetical protein
MIRIRKHAVLWIGVALFSAGCAAPHPATAPASARDDWLTLVDAQRHFRLTYPPGWKANRETVNVAHYTSVFAAVNSAGKEGLTVHEIETEPRTWLLNEAVIAQQVSPGTAYIDVAWQDGPGGMPQFGPEIREMEAADLSRPLKESKEERSGELITRRIGFWKWGRRWQVVAYMHAPVSPALRSDVKEVLASFRFDGVPAGDEVWALALAHKKLPPEADPQMYTRQGGSSQYYCNAKASGDEVVVTFTKHLENSPVKSWTYRVTATGEVIAASE